VEAVKEGGDIVAMSALLTTTMTAMKTTLEALEEAGVKDKIKTMIGGAPVTQNYADEIGADGYARDAASAADKAKELIGVG
jgi:5-methyltetrahydrofolate--homocysteine methyltransferase